MCGYQSQQCAGQPRECGAIKLPVHQAGALRKRVELGCFLCSTAPDLLCSIRYQVDGSLFCVPLALLVRKASSGWRS